MHDLNAKFPVLSVHQLQTALPPTGDISLERQRVSVATPGTCTPPIGGWHHLTIYYIDFTCSFTCFYMCITINKKIKKNKNTWLSLGTVLANWYCHPPARLLLHHLAPPPVSSYMSVCIILWIATTIHKVVWWLLTKFQFHLLILILTSFYKLKRIDLYNYISELQSTFSLSLSI